MYFEGYMDKMKKIEYVLFYGSEGKDVFKYLASKMIGKMKYSELNELLKSKKLFQRVCYDTNNRTHEKYKMTGWIVADLEESKFLDEMMYDCYKKKKTTWLYMSGEDFYGMKLDKKDSRLKWWAEWNKDFKELDIVKTVKYL